MKLKIIKNLINKTQTFPKNQSFDRDNRFILRELKEFRQVAILALIFTCISAVLEGIGVGFILSFLQSLTDPSAEPVKTGIQWFDILVLDVEGSITSRVYRISGLIFLTSALRLGAMYVGRIYIAETQMGVIDALRKKMFEQLQSVGLIYFATTRSGNLTYKVTTELEKIKQAFANIATLLIKGITLIVYAISLLLISWQLSIISIFVFTLLSSGVSNYIRRVREMSFAESIAGQEFTSVALEFINGIRTVHSYSTQEFERKRFYSASNQVKEAAIQLALCRDAVPVITESSVTLIIIGMIVISFAYLIPNGQIQVASLLTFLFVLFRLLPTLRQVSKSRAVISEFKGPINSITELLKTENKPYLKSGTIKFLGLKNAIIFDNVSFSYEPSELVLKNISFSIEAGKNTALVGSSGSGKSTLIDLIPRFYDCNEGRIFVDNIEIDRFDLSSLRSRIAIVSQDSFIFNASIRDNIAYGLDSISDSQVTDAARFANALEFIQEMPEGFNTILGDRGIRLSGGQRQRIAIARALLRNPEILILDEATSALDSVSEKLIQQSLEQLSQGRTVITIAHRLSTIVNADKVLVLEQGRIIEQGKYKELLAKKGALWQYHQMQHKASKLA
ncbi:MAG: ABC transporter ATP-binding protein [Pleurocapsa sp.]